MSSKTTTTTSNQYNSNAMGNYNNFQGTMGSQLAKFATNPLASSFFQNQLNMAQNQASQVGARNMQNALSNLRTGGGMLGNSGAFMQNLTNRMAMGNSLNQSNAFNGALTNALANQRWALASMQAFSPLQTGQTTTQQQSQGLGSILGSVASIGLGMAMPGLGSMLGGGTFGGGYKANPGNGTL